MFKKKNLLNKLFYSNCRLRILKYTYGSLEEYWGKEHYARLSHKLKTINGVIDHYYKNIVLSNARFKLSTVKRWVLNEHSVLVFTLLIPINFFIRVVYIHLYLLHIPYWLYKLYRYVRSNGYILDLKPWDNDPTFGTWYIVLLYRLTW